MSFIVESRRPGLPVMYLADPYGNAFGLQLSGTRADAIEFPTRAQARIASRRMSSVYNFVVTEVNP